ncbi:MAG: mycothiol system anti-sigma-R factor [Actinomycetia bacterium]|nr:mycothiol system anti-sigma-R factor [Actinomycetes bacterium]MCH9801330.1 mycothiol system anti-sigma-R factor [Actinomycetes bacterium]
MSCADDADCAEVLDAVYEYLHAEIDAGRAEQIRSHLDDCSSCLRQFGLEKSVQELIARSCGCTDAPESLRRRILQQITEIRVTGTSMTAPGQYYAETTVEVNRRIVDPER